MLTYPSFATIRGYDNSTAQAYAEKYGRTFESLGEYVAPAPDVLWGDANGDSTIDGKDILYIRKYLANFNYDTGVSNVEIGAGADANGDGNVDGKDILIIRKYLANYNFDTGESSVVLGPQ